jgi:hypothetical protein
MDIVRISRPSSRKPPYDFYEMQLIGDHLFTVAVPIDSEEDLKKKVIGAVKAHLAGQKSVDYVLKRYGKHWSFPSPDENILKLLNALRAVDDTVVSVITKISEAENKPENVGLFAAEMALMRLKTTFKSTQLLILQGYSFEAAALCRVILEQFGFAFAVYEMEDTEKIFKIKPSKTISNLKKLMPYSGRLYGELSSRTHIDPKENRQYIVRKDGSFYVRYNLHEDSKIILYYICLLAIDFENISNTISGEYFVKHKYDKFINSDVNRRRILEDTIESIEKGTF